jgi:hypothetical protein
VGGLALSPTDVIAFSSFVYTTEAPEEFILRRASKIIIKKLFKWID